MKCDEIFQEIQRLEQQRQGLERERELLYSVDGPSTDPFEDWMNEGNNREEAAKRALGERRLPVGAEGQPTNFGQVIDQLGEEGALPVAADLIGLTKAWQKTDDYKRYLEVNTANTVATRIQAIYAELGDDVSKSEILRQIQENGAPFVNILQNQERLRVMDDVTRVHMSSKVGELADTVLETKLPPSRQKLAEFIQAYEVATYAHGMANLARRRAGQLLQSLKGRNFNDTDVNILMDDMVESLPTEMEALADEVTAKPGPDGQPVPKQEADYVQQDEVTKAVVEAAIEGNVEELREIQKTLILDGKDPRNGPGNKGWQRTWMAAARAGYKDSILFSGHSMGRSNYLSQKLVYLAEGLRKFGETPYKLLEGPDGRQLNLFDPSESGFIRNFLQAQLEGKRIVLWSHMRAEGIINQGLQDLSWPTRRWRSMQRALDEGFFEGHTPFATRTDDFNTQKGVMSPDQQYEAGIEIVRQPLSKNPITAGLQLRNKMAWGMKILANRYVVNPVLGKLGIKPIPVMSALQMNAAIDQRQGMRVFLHEYGIAKSIEMAKKYPEVPFKDRQAMVDRELDEVLIKSNPTQGQIARYRKQYNLGSEVTDEMISSKLAAQNVGYPLLDTPEAQNALQASIAQRMQNKPDNPVARTIDNAMAPIRKQEWGDAIFTFWRTPFVSVLWDWGVAFEPAKLGIRTAQMVLGGVQGKTPTPKQLAEFESAALMSTLLIGSFAALRGSGNIIGGGPLNGEKRAAWRAGLREKGQKPNSIFGIPLGGVPIMNTLFLYNDIADVFENGGKKFSVSDAGEMMYSMISLVAAQILRAPGFGQLRMLQDAFSDPDSLGALRALSWQMNSWYNPANGALRDAEKIGNVNRDTLMRPKLHALKKDSGYLFDDLGPDHPLNQSYRYLQQMAYESQPAIAHWGYGVPMKRHSYLGEPLNRPPFSSEWEWPLGMTGERTGEGRWAVENQLEYMGQLQAPNAELTGMLEGVPVGEDLLMEYREAVGSVASAGYGRDAASLGGWSYQVPVTRGQRTYDATVDGSNLLRDLTKGRTLREALNAWFSSDQFAEFERTPGLTSDPRVERMSDAERSRRPAMRVVSKLQNYYQDLAKQQLMLSQSPDAEQWRMDMAALQAGKTLNTEQYQELRQGMR